jgi:DNA uptake protein ComE-like DNA-binding protein
MLLAVSVARWAWTGAHRPAAEGEDVLETLLDDSRAAADEAEARKQPLAAGERIDPNRAEEIQLDRLPGVGPATARAILAARESGIVFRRPEDLLQVRGIGPVAAARLAPLLDLTDTPPRSRVATAGLRIGASPEEAPDRGGGSGSAGRGRVPAAGAAPVPVDVNRADAGSLEALPGIGPELANRIVAERKKRPFTSLEDLERVPGIGPSTLGRIRGLATVGGGR